MNWKGGLSKHPKVKTVIAVLHNKGYRWGDLTLEQKWEMLNTYKPRWIRKIEGAGLTSNPTPR